MKNFNVYIFIIAMLTSVQIYAQEEEAEQNFSKNEIGISLNRMIIPFMSGEATYTPFGIYYKRLLNENWVIRANFNFLPLQNHFKNYDPINERINFGDTLLMERNTISNDFTYTGRLGVEYRIPLKNALTVVLGGDLMYQYQKVDRTLKEYQSQIDNISLAGTTEAIYMTTFISETDIIKEKGEQQHYGMSTSLGLLYNLSQAFQQDDDRWFLKAQYRINFLYGDSKISAVNQLTGETTSNNNQFFIFSSDASLFELSVFYRF